MLRILALSFLCVTGLSAQQADRVHGYVADQTGARLAGPPVTLRAISTNWKAATVSSPDGAFRFLRPPAGKLELRVEQPGFQAHTQIIDLEAQGVSDLTLTLLTASVQQSVEVTGASAMLQPHTAA